MIMCTTDDILKMNKPHYTDFAQNTRSHECNVFLSVGDAFTHITQSTLVFICEPNILKYELKNGSCVDFLHIKHCILCSNE